MKDVAFGQYFPVKSFVHNMDARIKILLSIAYIVAVFMVQTFHFLGFLACFLFVVIATVCARVPFMKVLKSIKAIIFSDIIMSIIMIKSFLIIF